MSVVINGTSGITNDGGYTGDGVVFADTTPANTLVTTTGGNVGIGTVSPTSPSGFAKVVQLSDASSSTVVVGGGGVTAEFGCASGGGWLSANGANAMRFATNGTERARIDSSGNLLVGTVNTFSGARAVIVASSAVQALTVANTATADSTVAISVIKTGGTNSTSQRYIGFSYNGGGNGNGGIAGNGDSQATFITLSDERLKENITDLPSQLDNVMALRPVEFDYKATGGHQIGFIAQEVQAVYPDLVSEGDEGYLTLAGFDKNTARLIKAIQEQQAIITSLTARVAALEGTTNV